MAANRGRATGFPHKWWATLLSHGLVRDQNQDKGREDCPLYSQSCTQGLMDKQTSAHPIQECANEVKKNPTEGALWFGFVPLFFFLKTRNYVATPDKFNTSLFSPPSSSSSPSLDIWPCLSRSNHHCHLEYILPLNTCTSKVEYLFTY